MIVDARDAELASPAAFAGAGAAGLALATLTIYAVLGLHDGFGDWDLHRVGDGFRRGLPWALAASAAGGVLLRWFWSSALSGRKSPLTSLAACVRAFFHFPLYGSVVFAVITLGFAVLALRAVLCFLRGERVPKLSNQDISRWIGAPLWFLVLPFTLMGARNEGRLLLPRTIPPRRLALWLIPTLAILALWVFGVREDGVRSDQFLLAAAATAWLGDWLIVARFVVPVAIARGRS